MTKTWQNDKQQPKQLWQKVNNLWIQVLVRFRFARHHCPFGFDFDWTCTRTSKLTQVCPFTSLPQYVSWRVGGYEWEGVSVSLILFWNPLNPLNPVLLRLLLFLLARVTVVTWQGGSEEVMWYRLSSVSEKKHSVVYLPKTMVNIIHMVNTECTVCDLLLVFVRIKQMSLMLKVTIFNFMDDDTFKIQWNKFSVCCGTETAAALMKIFTGIKMRHGFC